MKSSLIVNFERPTEIDGYMRRSGAMHEGYQRQVITFVKTEEVEGWLQEMEQSYKIDITKY